MVLLVGNALGTVAVLTKTGGNVPVVPVAPVGEGFFCIKNK